MMAIKKEHLVPSARIIPPIRGLQKTMREKGFKDTLAPMHALWIASAI